MTKFTGISIRRIDVLDKVTGKALYPGDLNLESTLNIKLINEKIHKDGNLLQYMPFEKGNIEMGFKDNRLIIRR